MRSRVPSPPKFTVSLDALDERVHGLEGDVQALGARVDTSLASMRADINLSLERIYGKLDNRDDHRWMWGPIVGSMTLVLLFMGGLGTLSLAPLKEDVAALKVDLHRTQNDYIERDRRIWDSVIKHRSEFDYLRGQLHPMPSR